MKTCCMLAERSSYRSASATSSFAQARISSANIDRFGNAVMGASLFEAAVILRIRQIFITVRFDLVLTRTESAMNIQPPPAGATARPSSSVDYFRKRRRDNL